MLTQTYFSEYQAVERIGFNYRILSIDLQRLSENKAFTKDVRNKAIGRKNQLDDVHFLAMLYFMLDVLNEFLVNQSDQIQCIVANDLGVNNAIHFGQAQKPTLFDFPDGVDVIKFLLLS